MLGYKDEMFINIIINMIVRAHSLYPFFHFFKICVVLLLINVFIYFSVLLVELLSFFVVLVDTSIIRIANQFMFRIEVEGSNVENRLVIMYILFYLMFLRTFRVFCVFLFFLSLIFLVLSM
jgi:hypothetical protein